MTRPVPPGDSNLVTDAPVDAAPPDERPDPVPVADGDDRTECRWSARLRRLMVAAVLAWLLFAVANLAVSGHFWLWAVPDLLPPLMFLAVPAGLGGLALALRRRTLPVALAVAGLVVGVPQSGLNPGALGPGPGPAPAGAIHVFSWNAEVWNLWDDPAHFYQFLRAQHADVYLLQEYQQADDPAVTAADEQRLHAAFPGYTMVERGELLTISRLPVVGVRVLGTTPAGTSYQDYYQAVKSLRTDVRTGGRVVSLYNVHIPIQIDLSSPLRATFYRLLRARAGSRRVQYHALARDIDANPLPKLVAGDFNTSPDMGEIHTILGRLHSATAANRSLYPTSWNAHWWPRLWRLDWAFTSSDVHVYRYAFRDPQGMSDHRAQDLLIAPGNGS